LSLSRNHGVLGLVNGAGMHQPTGVLFHMRPVDANISFRAIVTQDHDVTLCGQGIVVLADLKALGKIGVVVVLAIEERLLFDSAVQGQAHLDAILHCFLVDHRQRAGQSQADGAGMAVGQRIVVGRGAVAEHLGLQAVELHVYLKTNDDVIHF
jgi:hypothetical protein